MKPNHIRTITASLCLLLPALLASCGTTTALKSASGQEVASSARKFSKVTVQDFAFTAKNKGNNNVVAPSLFAERIAASLRRSSGFKTVSRNAKPDADTLVIGGVITRYTEGSPALRMIVGMGAGSSYFDATIEFKDSAGAELGKILADKNSWGLGGALAMAQTVDVFMDEAANKAATEARKFVK